MLIIFFSIWVFFFIIHRAYSYRWMYRTSFYQPFFYPTVNPILFCLHMIALIVLTILFLVKGKFLPAIAIIVFWVLTGFAIRRIAYKNAIKELAERFESRGSSHEEAISLAKSMIEESIH